MNLKLTSFICLCLLQCIAFSKLNADVGIFNQSMTVNGTLYSTATNLGSFAPNALILNGGGATSWQNSGDDVCAVFLDYSVSGGGPSGTITLNFTSNGSGADKNWSKVDQSINISGLPNGTYTLTANYRVMGKFGNITCFGSGNEFNTSSLANLSLTFTINSALPVTLTRFEAKAKARVVELFWATASEQNSSHFNVERSANAVQWETIGRAEAQGFSTDLRTYLFNDSKPTSGKNYYRLKLIDHDAKFEYSAVVLARVGAPSEVLIYPNPVVDEITVKTEEVSLVELFDAQGRLVKSWMSNRSISLIDQNAGIYQMRITSDQLIQTATILKH